LLLSLSVVFLSCNLCVDLKQTCFQEKAKEIETRFAAAKAAGEETRLKDLQQANAKCAQRRDAERMRLEHEQQAHARAKEVCCSRGFVNMQPQSAIWFTGCPGRDICLLLLSLRLFSCGSLFLRITICRSFLLQ
jgi:hypothetical protein